MQAEYPRLGTELNRRLIEKGFLRALHACAVVALDEIRGRVSAGAGIGMHAGHERMFSIK